MLKKTLKKLVVFKVINLRFSNFWHVSVCQYENEREMRFSKKHLQKTNLEQVFRSHSLWYRHKKQTLYFIKFVNITMKENVINIAFNNIAIYTCIYILLLPQQVCHLNQILIYALLFEMQKVVQTRQGETHIDRCFISKWKQTLPSQVSMFVCALG